jgi:CheY-like chemotaxis protein
MHTEAVRSVVIVDQSDENREVLRTALAHRGVETFEASEAGQGLELVRQHHPGVIVLDLEAVQPGKKTSASDYDAEAKGSHTSLVVLGSAKRSDPNFPTRQFVAKPYHYGPLIRKIEELLGQIVSDNP